MARGVCSDPVKEAEHQRKVLEAAQRRAQDPEWKRKNKEAMQKTAQERAKDPGWLEKNKEMCQRRSQDPVFRKKMSEAHKELVQNPEYIKKLSDAALAMDPEQRKNQKEGKLKLIQTPEWIKNHKDLSQKLAQDPDWIKNHTDAMRKLAEKPEQRMKNVESHIGGIWYGNVRYYNGPLYCEKFNEEFRERVRAYFGFVCPECGTPQNGMKLAVHHINFNKKSCCDPEAPRLFIPLCIKNGCHNKTNHNREYWESYFTEMIMGYYGGKCYFTKEEMAAFSHNL